MTRGLAAALTLAIATPAAGQEAVVDQARGLRMAGNLDGSERMLADFLRRNPSHYRAHYNLGLVFEARAVRAPPGRQRSALYRQAASHLERALQVRGKAEADYTIYNSLGVMYLGVPDLGAAEKAFSTGLQNQSRLSSGSRAKLYSNVGYLFALKGDMPRSEAMLRQAAALGSAPAASNLSKLERAGLVKRP
jgi:tetratricopeptide (TPR) repeat protein